MLSRDTFVSIGAGYKHLDGKMKPVISRAKERDE